MKIFTICCIFGTRPKVIKMAPVIHALSLQRIRDILWNVHEAHIEDTLTGKKITLQTNLAEYHDSGIADTLNPH